MAGSWRWRLVVFLVVTFTARQDNGFAAATCQCNGHAISCVPDCSQFCNGYTQGSACQSCVPGAVGNATAGGTCSLCTGASQFAAVSGLSACATCAANTATLYSCTPIDLTSLFTLKGIATPTYVRAFGSDCVNRCWGRLLACVVRMFLTLNVVFVFASSVQFPGKCGRVWASTTPAPR